MENPIMRNAVLYIHGKCGSINEAFHYRPLFRDSDVMGFDYKARSPWEAKKEFPGYFDCACRDYGSVTIIANSIGAFFAMHALQGMEIKKAYFISPIVNMQILIEKVMSQARVSEDELRDMGELDTGSGEKLSWKYLCYAREHPICWTAPTHILYGKKDHPSSFETICEFANRAQATLMVMKNGEHRFHTFFR